eukprot:TRINITY_DN11656_c0_g6_i1.p1 TRINITY_DN11656_c0_g6~~TRINITY_DN11656_c0_g6_i1.p1  ORF type:complete len:298 (-),score=53.26 TRINITY_DN11656_c0_g6_i1:194-1087(-)
MYLSTRKRYKKQLSGAEHVQRCLTAIQPEGAPLEIIKPACGVLRNAARNVTEDGPTPEQLHSFPWGPIVTSAVRIMEKYPTDAEVQYRSCGILVNVATCQHGANMTKPSLQQALALVLEAMDAHPAHSELHMWSLHFFLQYTASNMPNHVGAHVLNTLALHKKNAELQLLGVSVAQKLLMGMTPKASKSVTWINDLLARIYACCASQECLKFEDMPYVVMSTLGLIVQLRVSTGIAIPDIVGAKAAIQKVRAFVQEGGMGTDDSGEERREEVLSQCGDAERQCEEAAGNGGSQAMLL